MQFIQTQNYYFNTDQILGFGVYEKRNTEGTRYYTVNAIPLNIDHRDRHAVLKDFRTSAEAWEYLDELVATLNDSLKKTTKGKSKC